MKRFINMFIALFFLYAGAAFAEIEAAGSLFLKILAGKNQIFVLLFPDQTHNGYKIEPVVVREQTWNEFFRGVNPQVPQQFLVKNEDWLIGQEIEVYPKEDVMDVDFSYCVNQTALQECTHILVNKANGAIFFAQAGPSEKLDEFLNTSMKQMKEEAYQEGYAKAKEETEPAVEKAELPARDFKEEPVPVAQTEETVSKDLPVVTLPIALPGEEIQADESTVTKTDAQTEETVSKELPVVTLPIALPGEEIQADEPATEVSEVLPEETLVKNDPVELTNFVEKDESAVHLAIVQSSEQDEPAVAVAIVQSAEPKNEPIALEAVSETKEPVQEEVFEDSSAISESEASEAVSIDKESVDELDEQEDKDELVLSLLL